MNVLGVCKYQRLQSGKCNVSLLANAMFTYSAWTSVVFLLVTGIAKAYGSVKNKWSSRFFLPLCS